MSSFNPIQTAGSFTRQHPAKDGSDPMVYPTSGSLQHLPAKVTMAGDPAQPNPLTNKNFLANLPAHCYTLPDTPLNFTIVEILVLLPNWFRNKALCARFINNHLTGSIHFMILQEHRELQFGSEHERERARKWLTDEYRKAMRKDNIEWTRATHVRPAGWQPTAMGVDGFTPDDVEVPGYRIVPSIFFRDLAIGVKKMPEGPAAGDLTRALLFAIETKLDYLFPEDLSTILNYIGRTQITTAHTDRPLVHTYSELKLQEDNRNRALRQHYNQVNQGAQAQPNPQQTAQQTLNYGAQNRYSQATQAAQAQPTLWQDTPQSVKAGPGDQAGSHQVENAQVDQSDENMVNLLRQHLNPEFEMVVIPPTGLDYPQDFLLRDCIEGNIAFDGSPLARAAKFAQRQDQMQVTWTIGHVPLLNQLLDAARAEIQT
jgi:hypothetical protein